MKRKFKNFITGTKNFFIEFFSFKEDSSDFDDFMYKTLEDAKKKQLQKEAFQRQMDSIKTGDTFTYKEFLNWRTLEVVHVGNQNVLVKDLIFEGQPIKDTIYVKIFEMTKSDLIKNYSQTKK